MRRTTRLLAAAAAGALLAGGCGGGEETPGPGATGGGNTPAAALTVWTIEDVADRVEAQKRILADFTAKTGIQAELVAVAEDQFEQALTSAAAANRLPDVIGALSLAGVHRMATDDLLDEEVPGQVLETLGADTFSRSALDLTSQGEKRLAVPSDGWAQLLFYRKDLFASANLAPPDSYDGVRRAAETLHKGGVAGIVAGTKAGDSFTQQSFEHFALANDCQLVDDQGAVTLTSPNCVDSFGFYSDLLRQYSVKGNQDADTTRANYFAGKAAMVVWSSFLLDELAGLRNDALPTCPQCRANRGFLAQNTGVVSALRGPRGADPAAYGEIVSWAVTRDADAGGSRRFVEFMMSDGYERWLAVAPEGKVPTRTGTKENRDSYLTAWQALPAGVDRKAPLSEFYAADVLDTVRRSPESFDRWGFPQEQGALVGATLGELPVAAAVSSLVSSGGDPAKAAQTAQQKVEELKENLG